jgi:hypothetical protein
VFSLSALELFMARPVHEEEPQSGVAELLNAAGGGVLRLTLLFGSAAVALAIILTPVAQNQIARTGGGLDMMATGGTGSGYRARGAGSNTSYTVRRSVLQQQGGICIISSDGMRTGDC